MASDAGAQALTAGEYMPDFSLPDLEGRQRRLSDFLNNGPEVVSFYRGGWSLL